MFMFNFMVNGEKFAKAMFSIMILIILIVLIITIYNIFIRNNINENSVLKVSYSIKSDEIFEINSSNYTNILKATNENIDDYIGCKIHLTGYIYRLIDFKDNQFVVARDMVITPDKQSLVVGFLSNYDKAKDFKEISKGNFNGDIAILNVLEIKPIDEPKDKFVYPPDNSYIPTSGMF